MIRRLHTFLEPVMRDMPLPVRLFRLLCLTTGVLCLVVVLPMNILQNLPVWVNLGDVVLGLLGFFCYRESMRGRHWVVGFLVVMVLLIIVPLAIFNKYQAEATEQPVDPSNREAWMAQGVACYKTF
eukprot:gene61391-83971_t